MITFLKSEHFNNTVVFLMTPQPLLINAEPQLEGSKVHQEKVAVPIYHDHVS